jgi:serine/threonine-protein kinase
MNLRVLIEVRYMMKCPNCKHDNPGDSRFCSRCGRALEIAPTTPLPAEPPDCGPKSGFDFTPGQRFGSRYQIIEEIGCGGMGVVYKALDNELGRVVALKMIRPELTSDPGILERFKQELLLASEVSHENVIRIHDLGEADGIKYFSMRFIDGTSLQDLLGTAGRLNTERAVGIARQVANALSAAHRKGVIHRDLKPQNIMLDQAGTAYVMDFGIARAVGAEDTAVHGMVVGTPEYISPEQAGGRPADERADIYSLGCVLFAMLTGRKPFEAASTSEMLRKHMSENPVPPSRFSPGLSPDLDRIVLKCLEKDPAERYSSVPDLLSALEALTGAEQSSTTHAGPTSKEETSSIASLAVMPFRDMSPEKDQEYFCDGMAEEIANALVKIEGLRVAALTSTFQFKGKNSDIREVGEKLNVGIVLEGSVRKAGNRLRVTVQLVNVADGYHLWSERYDREMKDVFEVQDEISGSIAGKLKLRFADREQRAPAERATNNLEAYNLYLKGRFYWNKRTEEAIRKGIDCFKEAIEKDPTYALAYVGLADSYTMQESVPPGDTFPKARAAAQRALELDPGLAEARASLGMISLDYDLDVREALLQLREAIELNPNYASAHQWYGLLLMNIGRQDQGIREIVRARELDPLSPIINTALSMAYMFRGDYDEAARELLKVIDMDPSFSPAFVFLGWLHATRGDYERAYELELKGLKLGAETEIARAFEEGYAESGYAGAMRRTKDLLLEGEIKPGNRNTWAAMYAARLGEKDEAFELLRKAVEERERELVFMRSLPAFIDMRSDPRFDAFLKRIGLSEEDIRNLP